MISPMSKLTAFALSMVAFVAISLAIHGPACAKEPARKPVYSEGLWNEPVKPSKRAEPPAPVRGMVAKPPPSSAIPPAPR